MIERVKKYIRENQMLKAGDIVAAGVSGGADSIAMLHIPTLQSAKQQAGQKRSVSAKEFRVSSHKLFPAADEKPDTADAQAAETDLRPRKNTGDTTYIYK